MTGKAATARYKAKCRAEGRCPHCGEQCAPYAECEKRRTYKRVLRVMCRLYSVGAMQRVKPGTYRVTLNEQFATYQSKRSGRKGDRRFLPKVGAKPMDNFEDVIVKLAIELGKKSKNNTFTEAQVAAAFGAMRVSMNAHQDEEPSMIEFVLIVHVWTGILSKYESQSSVVVEGFKNVAECNAAGDKAKAKFSTGVRSADYVCLQRTR